MGGHSRVRCRDAHHAHPTRGSADTSSVLTPWSARASQSVPGSPATSSFGSLFSTTFYADACSRGERRLTEPSVPTFHIQTRLPEGRPALIVDPGSVGNLCGDKWAKEVAIAASRSGHRPSYQKRARPLQVSGVGNGAQSCSYDCRLPIGLRHTGSQRISFGDSQSHQHKAPNCLVCWESWHSRGTEQFGIF